MSAKTIANRLSKALRDDRGATAVFFAITLTLLAPLSLGIFDVYLGSTQRTQLQDALDSATLFAARSTATTTAGVDAIGDKDPVTRFTASGDQ